MIDLFVRDRFASPEEVEEALKAWPADGWHTYESQKRASKPAAMMPAAIAKLLHRMAALRCDSIPDLGLWGAGLHELPPGDGLGWHTDAERHAILGLHRRCSGVLYLCGDGDLEFAGGVSVRPAPGRLVCFDGNALHRVGPVTQLRRSASLFWYAEPMESGRTRAQFEDGQCH